jgi:hypothetical protein
MIELSKVERMRDPILPDVFDRITDGIAQILAPGLAKTA